MTTAHIPLAFVGDFLSTPHLLVILVVALLLFGKRLPEVARSLGKSVGEFKKGLQEGNNELNAMISDKPDQQNLPSPPANSSNPPDKTS